MELRWTRTTVVAAVAALTFVVVFIATLLSRPDPEETTAVADSQAAPTSPAEPNSDGGGGTATGSGGASEDDPPGAPQTTAPQPSTDGDEQDAAALAAATTFLGDVAGMTPVPGPVTRDGDRAEVTFYGRGEDGRVVQGMTTVVGLRRSGDSWSPTGARTPQIEVDIPTSGATVASPLTVTGRAHAYEGTVTVTVVEDRSGSHTIVGEGFVTGAGDRMGPFTGEVEFVEHNSERGWVVFSESSAVDGSTMRATIVGVEFAAEVKPGRQAGEEPDERSPAPTLDGLSWSPDLPLSDGWLALPAGAGGLTVTVRAEHADRVQLVVTPTGTETADLAEAHPMTPQNDGAWTATWQYGDQPVLAHLDLRAVGPGGVTTVDGFGLVKE